MMGSMTAFEYQAGTAMCCSLGSNMSTRGVSGVVWAGMTVIAAARVGVEG